MADFRECFSLDPTGSSPVTIEFLKLTEEPRIISIFTTECIDVQTHYVDTADFRGYLQCNTSLEGKCILCDTNRAAEKRFVLPVYDVVADEVKAMLISSAVSPHSLGTLLRVEIERGDLDERYLLISRKFSKYEVHSTRIPEGAVTGESTIAEFVDRIEAGKDSLKGIIRNLTNSELLNSPEIERSASCLGLKKSDYCSNPKLSQTAAG